VKAETFEGTISMTITSAQLGGKTIPMTINVKGDKAMVQMEVPQAGAIKMFSDKATGKTVFVMEAMKMGFEMPKADPSAPKETPQVPKPTGEKKTINGHYCEKYSSTSSDGTEIDMWLTTDMSKSLSAALRNAFTGAIAAMSRGKNTDGASAYAELFNGGKLPVEVDVVKGGVVQATVTYDKFEQKSLSDAMFIVPAEVNIQQMPAGMGGMGH
jgi:preprotein translocase subunit SecD